MSSRINCPNCLKEFMTHRGLQKHLLSVHQRVFIGFSDRTRALNSDEFDAAMQKHKKGQFHERPSSSSQPSAAAGRPSSILKVKIITPVRPAVGPVARLVSVENNEGVRRTETPPMPVLYPVNDLGAAQLDVPLPDACSVHSSDIDLSLLDKTLS